jgi:HEAT repeat protein
MSEPSTHPDQTSEEPRKRSGNPILKLMVVVGCVGALAWVVFALLEEDAPTKSLVRSLSSGDAAVRRDAAKDLGHPESVAPPLAIAALSESAAKDADAEVRAEAVRSLGVLGTDAIRHGFTDRGARTTAALIAAMDDKEPLVRRAALDTMPMIAGSAESPAEGWDGKAALGDPSRFVVRIKDRIDDPDEDVRKAALVALGFFSGNLDPAIPALLKGVERDAKAEAKPNRMSPATVLQKAKPSKPSVPALIEALKSTEPKVRYFAALLLSKTGPDAADAIPALIAALDQSGPDEREDPGRAAAAALGQIAPGSPKAKDAAEALKQAQNSENKGRSNAAAQALRKFEPKADDKAP